MPGRFDENYYKADLLADVLGRGKSSRLYQQLLKGNRLFSQVSAHNTGSLDPGLLVVSGSLNAGVSLEEADAAVDSILQELVAAPVPEEELLKVKNQAEATLAFSEVELLNRAMNLAYAANAGNADWVNQEADRIQAVTPDDVQQMAQQLLTKQNSSTMYYRAKA